MAKQENNNQQEQKNHSLWEELRKGYSELSNFGKTLFTLVGITLAAGIAFSVIGAMALAGVGGAISVMEFLGLTQTVHSINFFGGPIVSSTELTSKVLPLSVGIGAGTVATGSLGLAAVSDIGKSAYQKEEQQQSKSNERTQEVTKEKSISKDKAISKEVENNTVKNNFTSKLADKVKNNYTQAITEQNNSKQERGIS